MFDVFHDADQQLKGLLFQDQTIKEYLGSFPEMLFIDAIYKLLETRLPVYIVLCEDSMGNSEVVAVCLLCSEEDVLIWLFDILLIRIH